MIPQASGVAYCGLYCGGCVIREGNIGALADSLCRTMARPEFRKLAEGLPKLDAELFGDLKDHEECLRVLESMRALDCRKPCRQGRQPAWYGFARGSGIQPRDCQPE